MISAAIKQEVLRNLRPNRDDKGERIKRTLEKGTPSRSIIAEKTINGVEYAYHATKGWRSRPVGL